MADFTRISDLPDNTQEMPSMNGYMPIMNVHPNPYGPSTLGQMPPPESSDRSDIPIQRLPSRDIPQDTQQFTQDPTIIANHIPDVPNKMRNYMQDFNDEEEFAEQNKKRKEATHLDEWWQRLQIPLIVSLLYFIFQTAIVQTLMKQYFGVLGIFREDGYLTISGMVFKSLLFGIIVCMIEFVLQSIVK